MNYLQKSAVGPHIRAKTLRFLRVLVCPFSDNWEQFHGEWRFMLNNWRRMLQRITPDDCYSHIGFGARRSDVCRVVPMSRLFDQAALLFYSVEILSFL